MTLRILSSLTAIAVESTGAESAGRRIANTAGTLTKLLTWAERWPERQFAVEDAFGLGRGIAQQLAAAGEHVLDVPATLVRRARLLTTGGGRTTDPDDARSVAHHHTTLRQVHPKDQTATLRLLSDRRDDLIHERTRVLNRLHQQLRELIPGGADCGLTADKAAALLRRVRPATATDACRRDLARDLLADLRHLDQPLTDNETQSKAAITAAGTTLPTIHGIVCRAISRHSVGDLGVSLSSVIKP
ncbi:IS110 family transposase [Saccharopolyspora sp. K220]|nr:IS110 family transposase [Saccharopolyspora soli]